MPYQPFPNLHIGNHQCTSPYDSNYNCIAYAAGDETHNWWPHPDAHWPQGVPIEETLDAFETAFWTIGYERCGDGALEIGYEKIAIYAKPDAGRSVPKHAAKQLANGKWASKLGKNIDIEHDSEVGVEGPEYGAVAFYMRRKLPPA